MNDPAHEKCRKKRVIIKQSFVFTMYKTDCYTLRVLIIHINYR